MIPQQDPVKNHWGNNSATVFDFDFYIEKEDELLVTHTDLSGIQTTPEYGIDYSVNEIGNAEGSSIVFPLRGSKYSVLAWDEGTNKQELLTISLNLPISQEAKYNKSGDLDKKNLENSFDKLTRICQILARGLLRAVKVGEGSDATPEQLISELNQSKIIAKEFADIASNKAQQAENSATSASNSADIATQKSLEVTNTYTDAMEDITNLHQTAQNDIITGINNINTASSSAVSNISGKPFTRFCFNSGLVDTEGKAACVTVANNTLTLLAGSVCTSAGGTTYTVPKNISIDISSLTAGTHNFAYDAENQTIEEYSKVVISSTQPEDFSAGDIWLDNSVMPYSAKMKNSSGEIVAREVIPIPAKLDISTISDGGGGLTLMPKTYNNNGLDADILKRSDFSELSGLSAPLDNLIPLAVPASNTTITASATGYYYIKGTASAPAQTVVLATNGLIGVSPHSVVSGNGIQTCAFVHKGGKVLVFYNTPTINHFGFCPAVGERESEV